MPGILVNDGCNDNNPRDLQLYLIDGEKVFEIGQCEDCDIILDDESVAERHAAISGSDGMWRIKIVDEEAKILIGDKEVDNRRLRNGDVVKMGDSTLQFLEEIALGYAFPSSSTGGRGASPQFGNFPMGGDGGGDAPLSAEGLELLNHPELTTPGIYLTHGGILGEYIQVKGQVLLGRSSQCMLVFRDVDVSRTHASLEVSEDDKVILTDLASRNGVYVNDRRIVDRCELTGFDLVRLGNTEFIFIENDNNLEMFKKLVRRGSILLRKITTVGDSNSAMVGEKDGPPPAQVEAAAPGGGGGSGAGKNSIAEVFRKAKEEDDGDDGEEEVDEDSDPGEEVEK